MLSPRQVLGRCTARGEASAVLGHSAGGDGVAAFERSEACACAAADDSSDGAGRLAPKGQVWLGG